MIGSMPVGWPTWTGAVMSGNSCRLLVGNRLARGVGDRKCGPPRQGHDRDHRVGARRRRERTAVPDPHSLYIVQLAKWPGHARLRVLAHPRRAHLVRREQALATSPLRHALRALDEALEVVAAPPARKAAG